MEYVVSKKPVIIWLIADKAFLTFSGMLQVVKPCQYTIIVLDHNVMIGILNNTSNIIYVFYTLVKPALERTLK